MNYLIRLSALFAFAMFGISSCALVAQDAKTIQLDEQKIEQWAEEHADAWEKWAEKFESKMERWAESQEAQWEDWADKYSERWEDWGAKLESGDINAEEIRAMVERNLEMLKDMPLESLIDGALKEGLGGLKDAPFESLSELHELIGGSLEQSLQAMEKELSAVAGSEIKEKLKQLKTKDLHEAIQKLQGAIEFKQDKNDVESADTISRLEAILKKSSGLGSSQKDEIIEALHRELSDARALQGKKAKDLYARAKAMASAGKAKEMAVLAERMAAMKAEGSKAAKATKAAIVAQKMASEKLKLSADLRTQKKSLEQHYKDLTQQKAQLESKESAIAAMKSEIQKLRSEVERMKKQAAKKKD